MSSSSFRNNIKSLLQTISSLIMMNFKNSKTPKTYQSLICLFDKDLLRFQPATELTISAQLSNTKNVTEADVSQKLVGRFENF